MCDICVMNSVKDRMLSRRQLFAGGAALAAGVVATAGLPVPARAETKAGKVIDLTHTLSADFPTYFGTPQFAAEAKFTFAENGFNLFNLTVNEHTGTHIDAPLHFSADGAAVDEIPVENLVAPLCVIDIAARAAADPDTRVTPDDIRAWIAAHGEIPSGACVAMHSGWASRIGTEGFRNFDGTAQHYPGFHLEAVQMLLEQGAAASIAVDTLSLDHGISADFATHYAWLPAGRFGIECVAGLDQLPPRGATLVIGAPKHKGGTGGPCRLIALA
jgi:kynurenine formamidase